jgi:hypothetical protein
MLRSTVVTETLLTTGYCFSHIEIRDIIVSGSYHSGITFSPFFSSEKLYTVKASATRGRTALVC